MTASKSTASKSRRVVCPLLSSFRCMDRILIWRTLRKASSKGCPFMEGEGDCIWFTKSLQIRSNSDLISASNSFSIAKVSLTSRDNADSGTIYTSLPSSGKVERELVKVLLL
eukprot:CAMPEP_0170079420 /NCGR_PEP_ID=MMETSP0019_2-20121128/15800_1 /TAXON_ID=98059 /ORGANISM="Dinobryon sp., Strain UTEXLB2267" /LENGTH=111 /DNA_ID=CAMNT_0010292857 /DNA_START=74 /DNA_END=405 /DNA_ORIENTATION=-